MGKSVIEPITTNTGTSLFRPDEFHVGCSGGWMDVATKPSMLALAELNRTGYKESTISTGSFRLST